MGAYDRDMPGCRPRCVPSAELKNITVADLQRPPDDAPRNGYYAGKGESERRAPPLEINLIGELVEQFPSLRPPVVEGIVRQGEIINIISKSKVGKSWFGYGLGLSVVAGLRWLDRFRCDQGKVLLIDNELHKDNLAFRIPSVAEAMCILQSDFHESFHVCSLRGRLRTIFELEEILNESNRGKYALVIIDALYRMMPAGSGENDNNAMTAAYNVLDRYAEATGSAIALIHHSSKGDQSGKDVSDVGAGAGAQSRAADAHLILRPHEQENCVVLDAVLRSFAPIESLVLEWSFPLWTPCADLDPKDLKKPNSGRTGLSKEDRLNDKRNRVVAFLARGEVRECGAAKSAIRDGSGVTTGLAEVINSLVDDGNLIPIKLVHAGNKKEMDGWKLASE